jgi:hypothetical protein
MRTNIRPQLRSLIFVNIEVVLNDPAVSDLEMPAVGGLVAGRNHDACRFARFEAPPLNSLGHSPPSSRSGARDIKGEALG